MSIVSKIKETGGALWRFWTSPTGAFILAVSGIAVGYYIFYISRPILKYDTQTMNFISSKNQNEYKVNVKGEEYEDLYMTKVTLYNVGDQALSGSDVSKIGHDPIRIIIPEDAYMVHYTLDNTSTTEAVTAHLSQHPSGVVIEFDYLNPGYQIAASILHQNPNAEFIVSGSALNVNEITREWSDKQLKFWGLWTLGILYLLLVILYVYNHWYKKRKLWGKF